MIIPSVIETGPRGERAFDIFSLLLRERIVFLGTPIDDQVADLIVAQMLYLEREDPDKDINFYIHSPGGDIMSGLAIYDTMQLIQPDVATYAVGATASMATVLLCAGAKGKRFCMPNATIHMHQAHIMGGITGQAADIEIQAREIVRLNEVIRNILARHTGQSIDKVREDSDRDFFMDAEAARAYGLADEILQPRDMPKQAAGLLR
jgi:ATP-dependent Clp protease protease subunit